MFSRFINRPSISRLIIVVSVFSPSFGFAQEKTTRYVYDALGRLTYVEDSQNGNRDFDYDKAGNRLHVVTSTTADQASEPGIPARPINLSTTHIADCAWQASWRASEGATHYLLTDSSNSEQRVTATQGYISCPRGNPAGNKPKFVQACNPSTGCSARVYF